MAIPPGVLRSGTEVTLTVHPYTDDGVCKVPTGLSKFEPVDGNGLELDANGIYGTTVKGEPGPGGTFRVTWKVPDPAMSRDIFLTGSNGTVQYPSADCEFIVAYTKDESGQSCD